MIEKIQHPVWHCTVCGLVWLNRIGKTGKPKRCPGRECRKLATYGGSAARDGGVVEREFVGASDSGGSGGDSGVPGAIIEHEISRCRVYGCGLCKALTVKDKRRGL